MSQKPAISVIMCVYNAEGSVGAAIQSILSQSFADFEFIIIDDGSTDKSAEIIRTAAQKDPRIRFYQQNNTGLTRALNIGLSQVEGRYVARQDADDVSYPTRLQKQFDLMESRPDLVLIGANSDDEYPGYKEQWGAYDENTLQTITFLKPPFPHSSAMFRAAIAEKLGGYDESFQTAQDMEFWMRMAGQGRIGMIAEPLIRRHIGENAISSKRRWRQFYDGFRARMRHNSWKRKPLALLYSVRNFMAFLIPHKWIRKLKP